MSKILQLLRSNEKGVSSIEYAMLAVGIALAIFLGAKALGTDINTALSAIGNSVSASV